MIKCNYNIEELLPVVSYLKDKYTSKESSSITYEAAQSLMESALYCINEYFQKDANCEELTAGEKISAFDAYFRGYEEVVIKAKKTQQKYNEMILTFNSYGNLNYYDTVVKGIKGFFLKYDIDFGPQNTIITMDYPTIIPVVGTGRTGIDAISEYVDYIMIEQIFLLNIQKGDVVSILRKHRKDYKYHFFNICSIVLREILEQMIINKGISKSIKEISINQLQMILENFVMILVKEKFSDIIGIEDYLCGDCRDFAVEILNK